MSTNPLQKPPEATPAVEKTTDGNSVLVTKETALAPAIHIWTVQMAKWRLAKAQKITLLDITAKSGLPAFAPDYSVVMQFKHGEVSEDRYAEMYIDRMRDSLEEHPHKWEKLKDYPRVALACYCRAGEFCHRHLFVDLMVEYLEDEGLTVVREGELTYPNPP